MSLVRAFSRLSLQKVLHPQVLSRSISSTQSNWFKISPCLLAEPLKKKKRMDPSVLKAREDRRKKKLEKQIRRLEKNARQLKPLDELEIPLVLIDERKSRLRPSNLTAETLERRVLLEKTWAQYKHEQHLADIQMIDRIFNSQQKALDEVRNVSEELYQAAIQMDQTILPLQARGPVATPAIKDYDSPDGDYNDISKKWE